jgi:acetyltransferase-like isoleucine patch superfamily enzyme
VVIEEGCEVGDNTLIGHYSVLRPDTKIGANCKIGHYFVSEGNNSIGNNVRIGPYCIITRGAIVEDDVFIAPQYLGLNDKQVTSGIRHAPVIKRGARVGGSVTVLPGVIVGEDTLVGAGAVVTKDIPPGCVVVGNPARILKGTPDNFIRELEKLKESYEDRTYGDSLDVWALVVIMLKYFKG